MIILILSAFGLASAPVLLEAPPLRPQEALLAVGGRNLFALYAPEPNGEETVWRLRVVDGYGEKHLTFRVSGRTIRPLDIALSDDTVWLATWPQGFYRLGLTTKEIEKKLPGDDPLFRMMPMVGGRWTSPNLFLGLTRRFIYEELEMAPHFLLLDLENVEPHRDDVISIGNVPGAEDDLVGVRFSRIYGETALGCVTPETDGVIDLCHFDRVIQYREEGEGHIARGQRVLPLPIKDYLVMPNGRYLALESEGNFLFDGWIGFGDPQTTPLNHLSRDLGKPCGEPLLLDLAAGAQQPWVLLSCRTEGSLWAVPLP
ncbi:hypothetical protein H8D30_03060 [bacterium]|nr:hypothetical protein [bacterium]